MTSVMADGRGDPNGSERYRDAIEALCGVSYTLKFALNSSVSVATPMRARAPRRTMLAVVRRVDAPPERGV